MCALIKQFFFSICLPNFCSNKNASKHFYYALNSTRTSFFIRQHSSDFFRDSASTSYLKHFKYSAFLITWLILGAGLLWLILIFNITKTSPCNEYPLTPHFYIVKMGLTGV